jgi:hypothetical protein
MKLNDVISKLLIGSTTLLFATAGVASADNNIPTQTPLQALTSPTAAPVANAMGTTVKAAVASLSSAVRRLSDPHALEDAFHSYFAFKAAHPDQVKKPYLYFVDYGLPNTQPRGYVFDMSALRIVDCPFTVAHGRGSAPAGTSIPTKFSNAFGSAATSLGLYLTKATYAFTGSSGGQPYHSLGLRLDGVSTGFNDKALARGVVAHGAPYVTPGRAGTSKGCPAMEPARAQRLLPKLADGGMVFLFAPDSKWLSSDPWLGAAAN